MPSELTPDQNQILQTEYYGKSTYLGRDRLYAWISEKYPDAGISRRQLMKWLEAQEVHQLLAPRKETKNIKRTILSEPFSQVGIDLFDMSNSEYNGFKWCMIGVDLFSKKGYAVPMKNKEDTTALEAFKKLLMQMTQPPRAIRCDNGSEFISKVFTEFLERAKIKQILSLPGKPWSNGASEAFVKYIKTRIRFEQQYSGSADWVSMIPNILNVYNNSRHRIINMTPNEAEDAAKAEVKANIVKNVTPKNESDINSPKFAVGDRVRIKLENYENQKNFKGTNFSKELFTVQHVNIPRQSSQAIFYEVLDKDNKLVPKHYYKEDLLKCEKIENPVKTEEKYIVSKIHGEKMEGGEKKLLIQWRNYPAKKDWTWEPYDIKLDVPKMVEAYEKAKQPVIRRARGRR